MESGEAAGGSRGMGSNAPQGLRGKACGEWSGDVCAAVRHKSNGIFKLSQKSARAFLKV